MPRKVLVTGADGFIGSHLTEALVRHGDSVRAMVMYNSLGTRGWLDALPSDVLDAVEVVPGDVRDPYGVRDAVRGRDVVFHLAALIAIPYSYRAPDAYVDTNVKGTLNVLQAVRDLGVGLMIHTSTSEVYGTARYVPIDEEHPLTPQSPYSASKIAGDALAFAFHASFDTPVATMRPFNTYGPRQSARAVIPTVITQIASGAREVRLGALTPTRDFSHVSDTVSGFLAMAATRAGIGQVINLGSGFEISIGRTAQLIAEEMGAEVSFVSDEQRLRPEKSEVNRLFSNTAKAARLLGWTPNYAGEDGFRRGLRDTIPWFLDQRNLSAYRPGEYAV